MRFPPSFLEEIKARLPVSEVVRHRVKLMRAGREWKGLSPFNAEKTPSFFVNDQKMAWFDLSAGKNGNIFDFLMETEGLSFPEAVKRLAHEAGLALPEASPEAQAREKARATLYDVLELAASYFSARLVSGQGGAARAYLAGRGLDAGLQSRFGLGYALPEKYALRDALAARGIPLQAMIEAGLLIHGEDIAVPYDRFRDRIMFPIHDSSGRVIAFGGRALAKDAQPKYLNSPETALFHKGAILYNHHQARKATREGAQLLVAEGYVDVIALTSAGFEAAVAPLGTALTSAQCELLWNLSEEPILCFDGDRAGRKAAYRAIDMALPLIGPGRSFGFVLLPEGKDPDDLIRSGGRETVLQVLSQALPLAELIFRRETEGKVFTTPEQKAGLKQRLTEIARAIRDETLRGFYIKDLNERLFNLFGRDRHEGANRQGRGPFGIKGGRKPESPSYVKTPPPVSLSLIQSSLFHPNKAAIHPQEPLILLLLLNHPGLLQRHLEDIAEVEFVSAEARGVRDVLLDLAGTARLDPVDLRAAVEARGLATVLTKLEAMAAHAAHWYLKAEADENDAEKVLQQALIWHRKRALKRELQAAECALGQDPSEEKLRLVSKIQEELFALGGTEATVEGFGALSGRPSGTL